MNAEAIVQGLIHSTGKSRKEVLNMLKELSASPAIQKYLKDWKHGKKK